MNSINQQSDNFIIPYRIKIGVTGHRELKDVETLKNNIRKAIREELYKLFDNDSKIILNKPLKTPIALSILSPLAEGADRLVATEVLNAKEIHINAEILNKKKFLFNIKKFSFNKKIKTKEKILNIYDSHLDVVLPLKKEDYKNTFKTEDSKSEFEELFNKARRPITLKQQSLNGEVNSSSIKNVRRQAYKDVGTYVVDNCDVLIALWDGKPASGKGGTAEIIDYARKRGRPIIIISTVAPYNIEVEVSNGLNASSIENLEFFNNYHLPEEDESIRIEKLYHSLFENEEGKSISEETKKMIKDKILPYRARASHISMKNKNRYNFAGTIVYAFSSLAVASVVFAIMFQQFSRNAFLLEFIILLSILLLVIIATINKNNTKWIESRFLTERLRSAVYLAICRTEANPISVPPYLRVAHGTNDWTVKTFNEIWNRLPEMEGCSEELFNDCKEYIATNWIEDQENWQNAQAKKFGKKSLLYKYMGGIIFSIAMAAAIIHFLFYYEFHNSLIDELLISIAILLPAVGAAISGIHSHREYSRNEKRCSNMNLILTDMKSRFVLAEDSKDFESLLREADELMLREVQDWLMLMRFVELKPAA